MMSLIKLLPPAAQITNGEVLLEGKDLAKASASGNQHGARLQGRHDLSGSYDLAQSLHEDRRAAL